MLGGGTLSHLASAGVGRTRRISSWDRTGANRDFISVEPGERRILAEIRAAGRITHIWMTANSPDPYYLRSALLRMFWDEEEHPSVESPLGDFFGVGHGRVGHFVSLPLSMVTGGEVAAANKAGMNCYFPMPFSRAARIEVVNESDHPLNQLYFHIDFEEGPVEPEVLRFHALWRRECPTEGTADLGRPDLDRDEVHRTVNLDGRHNYVILEAEGTGRYVGCNLSVDHLDPIPGFSWFGEGDDMIFVDGEAFPPSLHGTGTEDYFGAAWGLPSGAYSGPYHGVSLAGPTEGPLAYSGKWTLYRFHIEDPVNFQNSIRVSIEHGHANCHSSDYSSVAYWYQAEPHLPFPPVPPARDRLPLSDTESLRRYLATAG